VHSSIWCARKSAKRGAGCLTAREPVGPIRERCRQMFVGRHCGNRNISRHDNRIFGCPRLPVYSVEHDRRAYGFAKIRLRHRRNVRLQRGDCRAALRAWLDGPLQQQESAAAVSCSSEKLRLFLSKIWNPCRCCVPPSLPRGYLHLASCHKSTNPGCLSRSLSRAPAWPAMKAASVYLGWHHPADCFVVPFSAYCNDAKISPPHPQTVQG
jgi:hypothetical protein